MKTKELKNELINDYNLSEEQIQDELKEIGISNEYLALVQLQKRFKKNRSQDAIKELLQVLNRQASIGKGMTGKGAIILSQIKTEGKNISINNENIDKLLELTLNANEMIKTGTAIEIETLEKIIALQT